MQSNIYADKFVGLIISHVVNTKCVFLCVFQANRIVSLFWSLLFHANSTDLLFLSLLFHVNFKVTAGFFGVDFHADSKFIFAEILGVEEGGSFHVMLTQYLRVLAMCSTSLTAGCTAESAVVKATVRTQAPATVPCGPKLRGPIIGL